jgi:hypothetical protein
VFVVLFYVLVIRVYLNRLHDTLIYEMKWLKLLPKEAYHSLPLGDKRKARDNFRTAKKEA